VTSRFAAALVALLSNFLFVSAVSAEPIVRYSTSGRPGNWLLDFSVTNTLGVPNLNIYFFGVRLPEHDTFAPDGWIDAVERNWTNAIYGGSATVYTNNWIVPTQGDPSDIDMGATLSGFRSRVTAVAAPTSVQWFAFAAPPGFPDSTIRYEGSDHFNSAENPGFEGVASPTPEPTSLLLAGLGLACYLRRRYHASV